MKIGLHADRRLFRACAVVLAAVAAMVALGVVPAVLADTYERAAPEKAATAFGVNAAVALALAAALAFGGVALARGGCLAKFLLAFLGLVGLLLGLALVDAAAAFGSHGPHMRTARAFMVLGAAGELLAGLLATVAALRGPKPEVS